MSSGKGHRWGNRPAVHLLNDFDALLQRLFAEQSRTAVRHLDEHKKNAAALAPTTTLDRLKAIWEELLPHRRLDVLETSIQVLPAS